jgi:hypothetical protein
LKLVSEGFSEDEVLDMPLDKVFLYLEAIHKTEASGRQAAVADLVNAIGIAMSGKGFEKYIKSLGE